MNSDKNYPVNLLSFLLEIADSRPCAIVANNIIILSPNLVHYRQSHFKFLCQAIAVDDCAGSIGFIL